MEPFCHPLTVALEWLRVEVDSEDLGMESHDEYVCDPLCLLKDEYNTRD